MGSSVSRAALRPCREPPLSSVWAVVQQYFSSIETARCVAVIVGWWLKVGRYEYYHRPQTRANQFIVRYSTDQSIQEEEMNHEESRWWKMGMYCCTLSRVTVDRCPRVHRGRFTRQRRPREGQIVGYCYYMRRRAVSHSGSIILILVVCRFLMRLAAFHRLQRSTQLFGATCVSHRPASRTLKYIP